jgi:hypothetical protein
MDRLVGSPLSHFLSSKHKVGIDLWIRPADSGADRSQIADLALRVDRAQV